MGRHTYKYPRPAVTVDLVAFGMADDGLRVLLIRRKGPPFAGRWAIPGGFLEMEEPFEAAARRELREETGLDLSGHDPMLLTRTPVGDCRNTDEAWIVTSAYLYQVPDWRAVRADGVETLDVRWWPFHSVSDLAERIRTAGGHLNEGHRPLLAAADRFLGPHAGAA